MPCFVGQTPRPSVNPEYGVYGTMTPGEVAESRRDDGRDMEENVQTGGEVERRMEAARSRDDRTQDRSMEKSSFEMER